MICLTGDVHYKMGNPEQSYLNESEASLAYKYLEIAQEYNIKATLFITGKLFKENLNDMKKLLSFGNLEIGGHTWSAFRPQWLHKSFNLLTGSTYGPKFYQTQDIRKTIRIIEKNMGKRPVSWRTHSYASDQNTIQILERERVKIVSDEVSNTLGPKKIKNSDLISLPINIMPDHEHLYHGPRTKGHVKDLIESNWRDSFTNRSFTADEYYKIITSQIEEIEKKNGVATLLLHPACMKILDNFKTFEKICKFINQNSYKTIWCEEVLQYWRQEKW